MKLSSISTLSLCLLSAASLVSPASAQSRVSWSGAALAMDALMQPGRPPNFGTADPAWKKWAKTPLTINLSLKATNVLAATNSTLIVRLAGQTFTLQGYDCATNSADLATMSVNLKPRREYQLEVEGTALLQLTLHLEIAPPWQPVSASGKDERPKDYLLLLDGQPGAGLIAHDLDIQGNCGPVTNRWSIEIRDEKLYHWYADDGTDDPAPAPGDGSTLALGPGKSLAATDTAFDWSVSLGRLFDGSAAGKLRLRENTISRATYSPTNIYYTASSTNARSQVELVTSSADGVLRQVRSLQAFVDFIAGANQTELRFYYPSQVATNKDQNGVYTTISGLPFVTWTLQNPEPATTNKLLVIEARNGVSRTNSLAFTGQTSTGNWAANYGTGANERVEARAISFLTNNNVIDRLESLTLQYASSNTPAYKCLETYRLLGWGWELVETRTDPDNANLTNTFTYYTDTGNWITYGRPKWTRYADGYWECRVYDEDEYSATFTRLLYILRPDKNGPANPEDASTNNCYVARYEYEQTTGRVVATSHFYHGSDYSTQFREDDISYVPSGDFTESIQARNVLEGGTGYLGTYTLAASDLQTNGLAGQPLFIQDRRGPERSLYYHGGTYNPATQSFATNSTSVADGPDWRQTILYGGNPTDPNLEAVDSGVVVVTKAEGQWLYRWNAFTGATLLTNRSYKEARVFQNGSLVQRELSVFTGMSGEGGGAEPQFETYQRFVYQNDSLGHVTNITIYCGPGFASGRTVFQADYKGASTHPTELLLWEIDENGTRTDYSYDSLKRVATSTKKGVSAGGGYPAQSDILTVRRYNAKSLLTEQAVACGSLGLTNRWTFDVAGRAIGATDEKGLTTTTAYFDGGRATVTTLPTGATETRTNYLDRRLWVHAGTAVVQETHDYWQTNSPRDGDFMGRVRLMDKTTLGPAGVRWKITGTDWLGLPVRSESPDYDTSKSIIEYRRYSYSLETPDVIEKTGQATQLLALDFDLTTQQVWQQIDTSPNLASQNRITRSLTQFLKQGSAWFKAATNLTYLVDDDATPTITGVSLERLSGFASTNVVSETTALDADTNATVTTTFIDRAAKKLTVVTDTAQSTLNATNVTINGLLQAESTPTVAAPVRHYYDGLSREIRVTNPLGFDATQSYNQYGQVTNKTDFTGQPVAWEYYLNGVTGAGQLKCETRANGTKTYYSYTARGERCRTWGDVPYPEERLFSDYGELLELHTYRGGTGWSGATWPANPGTASVTTWHYQPESGLLLWKTDDSNHSVGYTYSNGRLAVQTWSRGSMITNTYNWVGDLVSIEYSDTNTPCVYFQNFNRSGAPRTLIDGTGTNYWTYDHAGRLLSVSSYGGLYTGITVTNHINGVYGRDRLQVNGIAPAMAHSFGYDTYGRLASVSSGNYSAEYGYLPNSDLLQTTTCKNSGNTVLTTSRVWDYGQRLRSIANVANGVTVSSHAYLYDELNRRRQATLEDGSLWKYDYNDRDELTSGKRYWADWTPVAGQQFEYNYDNIGNRTTTRQGGDATGGGLRQADYTANSLNQYTARNVQGTDKADIIGAAYATTTVTVNDNAAYRRGEYYHFSLPLDNTSAPAWQPVTNKATLGASTETTIGDLLVPPAAQSLAYDADGNLTNDSVWVYLWDGQNRLIQMTNTLSVPQAARKKLVFGYDFTGRRASKTVYPWSGADYSETPTTAHVFVHDLPSGQSGGWNLLAVLSPQSSVLQAFLWGQDLSGTIGGAGGAGGYLAYLEVSNGQAANCHFTSYDGNGNVVALTRASDSAPSARYDFPPFGQTIRITGPLARENPTTFSTKFLDLESGLMCFGSRYYTPPLGRWANRDPIEEAGGVNLLAFCNNNSVSLFDPDGCALGWDHFRRRLIVYNTTFTMLIMGARIWAGDKQTLSVPSVSAAQREQDRRNAKMLQAVNNALLATSASGKPPPDTFAISFRIALSGDLQAFGAAGQELDKNLVDLVRNYRQGESAWAELDALTAAANVQTISRNSQLSMTAYFLLSQ